MTALVNSTRLAVVDVPKAAGCESSVGELPWIEDAGKVAPKDARAVSKLFFDRLRVLDEGSSEYQYARNTLIELNLSLVRFAAGRFRNRSEDMEDIVQVGTIGLIKAIDRFDLSREVEFTTFAIPYITGEIKRFFRDTSWAVHVPRSLQERRIALAQARDALAQRMDRSPTTGELADYLDLTPEEVNEGLVASNGYTAGSLDIPAGENSEEPAGSSFADRLGADDPGMEAVENLQALKPLMNELDERDRRILRMRFGQEMTQSEIGAELGVSQMHVSRLLTRTLSRLRAGLLTQT
ncbi:RNA polymerase sigma factor SigF [Streptomyces sp. H10-C2]|uniref:RNA polymerase sigma factor SigF n=1 Tax=unclassified Streptomyces TaxID=2593676 RepID=UPI0024BBB417|nr:MULTISPECIES: RNA polymerase sigma factor SigF [unclassified Streptomyces]MDJ0340332.1 RNA polymerase sigma factor SigF [Streptomyces sp. PH10-H1]MDJ0368220.1 RNA polymerase sigma factor SigF [Streptomyces sp. H10-C2]